MGKAGSRPKWATFNAQSLASKAEILQLMVMCGPSETRWWRTALLLRDMLVKKKNSSDVFFVVGHMPEKAAALLWPARKEGKNLWMPAKLETKHALRWGCVLDTSAWQVFQTGTVSPLHFALDNKSGKLDGLHGKVMVQSSGTSDLVQYHANRGFANIPVSLVKKIRKAGRKLE